MKASSYNLNFSIHFDFHCAGETQTTATEMYEKIQTVTRRFHMRLHASDVDIQFLYRSIKFFIS